uniref:Uncharacterized protein n=1 Tax=Cannabis sativa TaxID=3483 RepID=A0A803PC88_CANSA
MPPPVVSHLRFIIGGPHIEGKTSKARVRYAWTLRHEQKSDILVVEERDSKQIRLGELAISFIEGYAAQVRFPHKDSLVITAQIGKMIVARCMVDNEASANILFNSTYENMGLKLMDLAPFTQLMLTSLIQPEGSNIDLRPMPKVSNEAWGGMSKGRSTVCPTLLQPGFI